MSNWCAESVPLREDILPLVAYAASFAPKGGAAINLFEHYLPRLSADIGLTVYWRL